MATTDNLSGTSSSSSGSAVNSNSSKTVTFDVGGTIYRVSRSLIAEHPDTMLARLVSDTWSGTAREANGSESGESDGDKPTNGSGESKGVKTESDGDKPTDGENPKRNENCDTALFIERNGERFQYCLDYMRDGGVVHLPPTISKDALLQDMAYYGFEGIDPSKISVKASFSMLKTCFEHADLLLKLAGDLIEESSRTPKYFQLIDHCLRRYKKTGSLEGIRYDKTEDLEIFVGYMRNQPKMQVEFNACLERFGLKLRIICYSGYTLSLTSL